MMAGLIIRPFIMETDLEALSNYCLPIEQAIYTSLPLKVIEDFRKDKYNLPMVIYLDEDLIVVLPYIRIKREINIQVMRMRFFLNHSPWICAIKKKG